MQFLGIVSQAHRAIVYFTVLPFREVILLKMNLDTEDVSHRVRAWRHLHSTCLGGLVSYWKTRQVVKQSERDYHVSQGSPYHFPLFISDLLCVCVSR